MDIWVKIPGFPDYEVSSGGQIRNRHGRVLKTDATDGYHRIGLRPAKRAKQQKVRVSRMVCLAFHGEPLPLQEASHLDGDTDNNRLSNLTWESPLENAARKIVHGTQVRGNSHGASKLTEEMVRAIMRDHAANPERWSDIARRYGVTGWSIGDLFRGRTWRHVTGLAPKQKPRAVVASRRVGNWALGAGSGV